MSIKFFSEKIFEKLKHLVMKRNFRNIPLSWGACAGDILDVRNSRPTITHRPRWNLPTDKIYHTNLNLLSTNSKLKQSVYGWVETFSHLFPFLMFYIPSRAFLGSTTDENFKLWLNFCFIFFIYYNHLIYQFRPT